MSKPVTAERRKTIRDNDVLPTFSGTVTLPNGRMLTGSVKDYSDGGVRLCGPQDGLAQDMEVGLTLSVFGQKTVSYRCKVRHLHPDEKIYGLGFVSPPERAIPDPLDSLCPQCDKEIEPSFRFCAYCGHRLTASTDD